MGKTVVLGVTGSIAAYKACEIVRLCVRRGWDVSVVMTPAAAEFVTALSFRTLSRNPVGLGLFDEPSEWMPGHIGLAEAADVFVVAPCTANTLAKMANGLADNLLTCTALATRAPVVVAPAMNTGMWDAPATQQNVAALRARGVVFVEAEPGELACGAHGRGRLAEPAAIVDAVAEVLANKR